MASKASGAADASARADLHGLYTCPQTCVALACLSTARQEGIVRESDRVVVMATAHGLKFTEFKTHQHSESLLGTQPTFVNRPIQIKADVGAINECVNRAIDRRLHRA